jgi:hypothetical protein
MRAACLAQGHKETFGCFWINDPGVRTACLGRTRKDVPIAASAGPHPSPLRHVFR